MSTRNNDYRETTGVTRPPTEAEMNVAMALDAVIEDWFRDKSEAKLNTLDLARAAIRAMREPTPEMEAEFMNLSGPLQRGEIGPHDFWQRLIDAASPEEST